MNYITKKVSQKIGFFSLGTVIFLGGCSAHVDGKYIDSTKPGNSLELKSDNTFYVEIPSKGYFGESGTTRMSGKYSVQGDKVVLEKILNINGETKQLDAKTALGDTSVMTIDGENLKMGLSVLQKTTN